VSSECEKVVLIVEQSFWQKLNFWKISRMRFHLLICKKCSEYEKDSTVLHRILCSTKSSKSQEHLDDNEKEKLKKALK
jgi:hypothetical protein